MRTSKIVGMVAILGISQFALTGCLSRNSDGTISATAAASSTATPTPTPAGFSISGKNWLTGCMDMGGGAVNQVYASVSAGGVVSVAILFWNTPGCTGTYTMTDNSGNPTGAPVAIQNLTYETVSGLPTNIGIMKATAISDGSFIYIVAHSDGTVFEELLQFAAPHSTWADWLAVDADVGGFAAAPASFSPATYGVLRFTSVSALP